MIKKQKIKSVIMGIFTVLGLSGTLLTPAFATSCAGVQTSIISCGSGQSAGTCPTGTTLTDDQCTGGVAIANPSDSTTGLCPSANTSGPVYSGSGKSAVYGTTVAKDSSSSTGYAACPDFPPINNNLTSTGLWGILLIVINILTAGIGVAAVGGIVYGAILYTSAGGSAEQVKKARTIITNVIIGLVAYALMFSLLNFLIPGGLFN